MSNLFVSLFLAASISFTAPVIIIGCILGFLSLIGYVPLFLHISEQAILDVLNFLAVFGNGKPIEGVITFGITLGIVGILLDLSNFYRYQSFSDKDFDRQLLNHGNK